MTTKVMAASCEGFDGLCNNVTTYVTDGGKSYCGDCHRKYVADRYSKLKEWEIPADQLLINIREAIKRVVYINDYIIEGKPYLSHNGGKRTIRFKVSDRKNIRKVKHLKDYVSRFYQYDCLERCLRSLDELHIDLIANLVVERLSKGN